MTDYGSGFMIFLRQSMLYLTELAEDGVTPAKWGNQRKSALVIPEIKDAYIIAKGIRSEKYDCALLSIDSLGIVRMCNMPAESTLKTFAIKVTFDSGGSINTDIKVRNKEHAVERAMREAKSKKVVSIKLTHKVTGGRNG